MAPKIVRRLLAASLLVLPLAAVAQKKSASEYTVEEFFRRAEYQNMVLSPNGERLAATIPYKGRANLVVIDLNKRARNLISSFETMDVGAFYWVNNERVCMRVAETQDVSGAFNYRGTYCVDHDGQNLRDYTKLGARFQSLGAFQGTSMLVAMPERSRDSLDAYRFDTLSGKYDILTRDSPGDVVEFVPDRDGVIRIAVSAPQKAERGQNHKRTVWHRASNDAKWEKLTEYETMTGIPIGDYWDPIAFDFDNQTLYISGRIGGRDKAAIYKYDTRAKKMGDVMFEHALVDVADGLIFSRSQKKLLGVRFQADKPVVRWVDDDLDRIQKAVDATFKDTVNEIRLPIDSTDRALVFTASGSDPGMYYLYDRKRNGVEELMKTRDWLDPKLLAERKFITYKARDGRTIPAYLTLPRGADKNLPLIVHVHGGPQMRGYFYLSGWGRWPDAQFFASRGYAVLEPEPRGSTGFGQDHWRSGWKQWGLTAQDDLNDGALSLASQGIVDKSRMCIIGASYGGYASAEAAARDSGFWKCAVPYLAVTDLFNLAQITYTDIASSDYQETDFLKVVGDPRADRDMLVKSSPARNGDKVKIPVFLAMGGADVRVPEVHGAEFYNAVTKAGGGPIEYKVYSGEAHGFTKDANVFDFYKRVEKFFADNLKK
jgi:dipeptidyl aminopeptidase/acylaminoacyl peptidase